MKPLLWVMLASLTFALSPGSVRGQEPLAVQNIHRAVLNHAAAGGYSQPAYSGSWPFPSGTPGPGGTNGDDYPPPSPPPDYGSNLFLEITGMDGTYAYLILTNTDNANDADDYFQLLSKTNALAPAWTLGQVQDNHYHYDHLNYTVPVNGQPMMFFWAHGSPNEVSIAWIGDAIEPCGPGSRGPPVLSSCPAPRPPSAAR